MGRVSEQEVSTMTGCEQTILDKMENILETKWYEKWYINLMLNMHAGSNVHVDTLPGSL